MPDLDYWKKRWDDNLIGFHRPLPHDVLVEHYELIANCKQILIPLAGKTPDIVYLLERGHDIVAVEFCQKAVLDFFNENNIEFHMELEGQFEVYRAKNLKFFCGDLFQMSLHEFVDVSALYDRGAMIALDREQRKKYAILICQNLPSLKLVLSSQIDYGPLPETIPPYSVNVAEINDLYGKSFHIKTLEVKKSKVVEERFAARGATYQHSMNYLLRIIY